VNEIVEELITLASDKNILGRCYIRWNPFVWFWYWRRYIF